MPAVAAYFYNRIYHSKEYDQIPEDTKNKYFVIVNGTSKDEKTGNDKIDITIIPKGDFGQLFSNPLESFLDWSYKKAPLEMGKVALNWLSNLSPIEFEKEGKLSGSRLVGGALPPIAKAPIEAATGKNLYWGKDVVPEKLQKVAPEEQYTEHTPETIKWLGRQLNVSPLHLQNFLRNIVGAIGGQADPLALGKAVVGRIIRSVPAANTEAIYSTAREVEQGYMTARLKAQREIEAGNRNEAWKLMQEWNKQMPTHLGKMAKVTGQSEGKIRAAGFYQQYTFQGEDLIRLIKYIKSGKKTQLESRLNMEW
jgi:hypothetical protein